jgi:hypothetical protein
VRLEFSVTAITELPKAATHINRVELRTGRFRGDLSFLQRS